MAVVKSYWSLIYTTVLPFGRIKMNITNILLWHFDVILSDKLDTVDLHVL